MKTFLFEQINNFKKYSLNLEVKSVLCDRAWNAFNDSGQKKVYIFQNSHTKVLQIKLV